MESPAAILVVDDDENLRSLLYTWLSRYGYSVVTAANGAEAIEILTRQRFELVITDMNMPMMSGVELIRRMRKSGIDTPVIPMSGAHSNSHPLLAESVALGALTPLEKPFTPKKLLETVRVMLANRR